MERLERLEQVCQVIVEPLNGTTFLKSHDHGIYHVVLSRRSFLTTHVLLALY